MSSDKLPEKSPKLTTAADQPTRAAEAYWTGADVLTLQGTSTDRYEAKGTLGKGGMGEVRLCADRRVGREIAMKVMHKHHAGHPELRGRFVRELLAQGQLEHPSVVPVYDAGVDE